MLKNWDLSRIFVFTQSLPKTTTNSFKSKSNKLFFVKVIHKLNFKTKNSWIY